VKLWIELFWLSLRGPAQGFCEYNNEHSGYFVVKVQELLKEEFLSRR
jgi:hypothetical protein